METAKNPNKCDYCDHPLDLGNYRLELPAYEAKSNERKSEGYIVCRGCGELSFRALVFSKMEKK